MADADFSVKAIISAQTSQFEKGIKNAQSSVNSLSSSISNITNLVKKAFAFTGIAIGTKAIVDFGKSCVQEANEAIKTFNILDNTVKATGADAWTSIDELENASKSLSDSTNYSVTEIQQMQSVLLGFTNITGEAFDGASEAVLDMATVMGMDLTSAVQTIGKALDDPITGLDSLRRQGFKFTDEQKAELAQLVRNGEQLKAQKIILDTLAISYGGAAKAGQDSFAKQRHSVEDLQEAIGVKLIPVMQVFAENNTQMINSLRKLIENMDFTPVVNVVTNLNKIFNETFNKISEVLQKVGAYVSDFITRFNFKPIISMLDGLLGGLSKIISKFKEINSQKLEIFDKLKEALINFSNSETFQNIVDFVNKIIDAVFFLWSEIQDIGMEIRNLVVNKIIEIWGKIKELFQNSQNALAGSGQDIASWGDLFYDILNNTFRIFQDFFGMIKALIHGDWSVAWEYAKLTVMRIADNILDIFSTIANAFPDLINGILKGWNKIIEQINKVREFFGQDPLDLADMFESVDLSKKSGLEDKIKETENKIQELTGKSADITIQNLESVSTKFTGFTQHALGEIGKLTEGVETNSEKQKQYFSSTFSSTETNGESTYEKFSEWDSKLLQQRLEDLGEWSDEAHKINLQLIEEERKKSLEADKSGAETEKINEYYNKQIEKENERSEKAKREKVKETMKFVFSTLSNIAKNTINIFKNVVSNISSVFSKIKDVISNIFSGIKNIFTTLFEFDVDEALDNLLEVEDSILTFFVETLPRLPSFFESAFSSVLTLIGSITNSINWENVQKVISSIIETVVTYAPKIIKGIVDLFVNLGNTIQKVLVENAPSIVDALGTMFFTIIESLPGLITNVITVAGTYISQIGKYITDNAEKLSTDLTSIVKSIVDSISTFITNGGWKNILSAILTIQKSIENAVADNMPAIAEAITNALPDLVQMLIDSIVSASRTLGKIAKTLLPLIAKIINALVEVITSDEVVESSIEAIEGIIEGLIPAIVDIMVNAIPKLITFFLLKLPSYIPKLIAGIIKALVKGFSSVNWGQVVQDVFTGFVDAFKNMFGIHSPSTLFESFGGYIVQGFVNGLKGIAEATMIIIQPIINLLQSTFSGLGELIMNSMNASLQNVINILNTLGSITINLTNSIFGGLKVMVDSSTESMKVLGKVTIATMGAIVKTMADVHNILRDIIKSVTTIKVQTPWQTYEIGGVDIGTVSAPDISGYIDLINAFAKGTDNAPKGLAIVGEAGPELVNFNGGEQVLNNRNTNKTLEGMGTKTNNFNVTFNNLQDTSAYAMMNQLKQYNRQMAINGIL